jgi:O-antigen/teichoic acid export membrane protein
VSLEVGPVNDEASIVGFIAKPAGEPQERPASRSPLAARLAANVGWLLLERVFLLISAFVVNVWFVRYLGPERYGTYAYALSFAALFVAFAGFGTDAVVVRDLAREPEAAGPILGSAIGVRMAAGLISWLVAAGVVWQVRDDAPTRHLVVLACGSTLFVSISVFDLWFQSRIQARPIVIGRSLVQLAAVSARLIMLYAGASLLLFGAVQVAVAAGTAAAAAALYARASDRQRLQFERHRASRLVRESWPLLVAGIAVSVYIRIDQVMLDRMVGDRETGLYATAVALSEVMYFVPVAVAATIFPVLVKKQQGLGWNGVAHQMQRYYDLMVALSLAIALPVVLGAHWLVPTLFGARYAPAAGILEIHGWCVVFVALGTVRSHFLIAEGLTRFAIVTAGSGAVLNVALNLVLIPRFAGIGAASATLASQVVAAYATGFLHPSVRGQARMATRALLLPLRPTGMLNLLRAARRGVESIASG